MSAPAPGNMPASDLFFDLKAHGLGPFTPKTASEHLHVDVSVALIHNLQAK